MLIIAHNCQLVPEIHLLMTASNLSLSFYFLSLAEQNLSEMCLSHTIIINVSTKQVYRQQWSRNPSFVGGPSVYEVGVVLLIIELCVHMYVNFHKL